MKKSLIKSFLCIVWVFILLLCSGLSYLSVSAETDSATYLSYGSALTLIANNSTANSKMSTIQSFPNWIVFQRNTTFPTGSGYYATYIFGIASNDPLVVCPLANSMEVACGESPRVFCCFKFSWNPYGPYWYFSDTNFSSIDPDNPVARYWNQFANTDYYTPSYNTSSPGISDYVPGENFTVQQKQGTITYYPSLSDLNNNTNGQAYPPYKYFTGDYWNYTLENETLESPESVGDSIGFRVDNSNSENGIFAVGGSSSQATVDYSFINQIVNLFKGNIPVPQDVKISIPSTLGGTQEVTLLKQSVIEHACANALYFRTIIKLMLAFSVIFYAWYLFGNFFNMSEATGGGGSKNESN